MSTDARTDTPRSSAPDPEFRFTRLPWLSSALALVAIGLYYLVGPPGQRTVPELIELGAKSRPLIIELHQYWRLLTANLLHASAPHLWMNVFFLFNLGGLAENLYRRIDVGLTLFTAALVSMGASFLASTSVSVGMSGLVFGAWGAVAVAVVRYRSLLPRRHVRVLGWSLIPYAAITIAAGLATPMIDSIAHLGGIVAGALVTLTLRPRFDTTSQRVLPKIALLVAGLALATLPQRAPPSVALGATPIGSTRLTLALPVHWDAQPTRDGDTRSLVYENSAGVAVELRYQPQQQPVGLRQLEADFRADVITPLRQQPTTWYIATEAGVPCRFAGHPAVCCNSNWTTADGGHYRIEHILAELDGLRLMLSFKAPRTVFEAYRPVWLAIKNAATERAP
jgi:rhomboid protease GluP